jgi:hypothetical protein
MCTQRFELKHKPLGLILRIGTDLHSARSEQRGDLSEYFYKIFIT